MVKAKPFDEEGAESPEPPPLKTSQWRIQGGGNWAIAQCSKIYCPVILGDGTYGPVLRNIE
jgi:hypothetical protein